MEYKSDYFVLGIDLSSHPIKKTSDKNKYKYIVTLNFMLDEIIKGLPSNFCEKFKNVKNENYNGFIRHIDEQRKLYLKEFNVCDKLTIIKKQCIENLKEYFTTYGKCKYKICLICDLVLILQDEYFWDVIGEALQKLIGKKRCSSALYFINALKHEKAFENRYKYACSLIDNYYRNRNFLNFPERRILITANMSAGKSTLINAIVGRKVAKTAAAACTGNVCYIKNKSCDDYKISLYKNELSYDADDSDIKSCGWDEKITVSTSFKNIVPCNSRVCFIDTPGADYSINKEHLSITKKALKKEKYDTLIYVVNSGKSGTDSEIKHLKRVYENCKKCRIIFVLNKLDSFNRNQDNVAESIKKLQEDLIEIGFKDPIICPISAYFGLLIKMKLTNQELDYDQKIDFDVFSKKFHCEELDLSKLSYESNVGKNDSELIKLSKKSGLYGLEKIIWAREKK